MLRDTYFEEQLRIAALASQLRVPPYGHTLGPHLRILGPDSHLRALGPTFPVSLDLHITEAVVRRCSVKKLFYTFRKIHRKTPLPESLF